MENLGVISLLTSSANQDHSILPTSPCPIPSSTAVGTSVSQILLLRTWNNLGQEFPACFRKSLRAPSGEHVVGVKMQRMALFGKGLLGQRSKSAVAFEDT